MINSAAFSSELALLTIYWGPPAPNFGRCIIPRFYPQDPALHRSSVYWPGRLRRGVRSGLDWSGDGLGHDHGHEGRSPGRYQLRRTRRVPRDPRRGGSYRENKAVNAKKL